MRLAAILLILAISATMVAGAQCVVACVHPAAPPPCHHSPQKAAKTCDASSVFDEKRTVTLIESPVACDTGSRWNPDPPQPPVPALAAAASAHRYPPGERTTLVLRI
jgi:hypothetical protein